MNPHHRFNLRSAALVKTSDLQRLVHDTIATNIVVHKMKSFVGRRPLQRRTPGTHVGHLCVCLKRSQNTTQLIVRCDIRGRTHILLQHPIRTQPFDTGSPAHEVLTVLPLYETPPLPMLTLPPLPSIPGETFRPPQLQRRSNIRTAQNMQKREPIRTR